MLGTVLSGSNNIYTVQLGGQEQQADERIIECRIKGKILKEKENSYNPLCPGDRVRITLDRHSPDYGLILEREKRSNALSRWNKKRRAPQIIAANVDLVVCVSSPENPPFRPRFIDRVIIAADYALIPVLVVLNKLDLGLPPDVQTRLENYRTLGYPCIACSAKTGTGVKELEQLLSGKNVVFSGQSGVGKSTLLNRIQPGINQKVGEISSKHNRGTHTTSNAVLIKSKDQGGIIDTPGIREIIPLLAAPEDLPHYFIEFKSYDSQCAYPRCSHSHEPGCKVKEAVEKGLINGDRYTSYLSVRKDLAVLVKGSSG